MQPDQLLDFLRGRAFEDLRGFRFEADIPLTESLINLLVQRQVFTLDSVEQVNITLPGEDTMILRLKAKISTKVLSIKLPVQREIVLDIDRQVTLSPRPVLNLRIREGLSGLDRTIMGWFQNLISQAIPGELDIRENLIQVDIAAILADLGLAEFGAWIRLLTVEGQPGRLMIRMEVMKD